MPKQLVIAAALALAASTTLAGNCDAIRSQIEAKIRASGVGAFTLTTVAASAQTIGRVVGTCDLGSKKIVYDQAGPRSAVTSASQPSTTRSVPDPGNDSILTECKDGSVSLGGSCTK